MKDVFNLRELRVEIVASAIEFIRYVIITRTWYILPCGLCKFIIISIPLNHRIFLIIHFDLLQIIIV